MNQCISQIDLNDETNREYNPDIVRDTVYKLNSQTSQEVSDCDCDLSELSNHDCFVSGYSEIECEVISEKKSNSFRCIHCDLKNSERSYQSKENTESECDVPKLLINEQSGSENSENECVEDSGKSLKTSVKISRDFYKIFKKDKVRKNLVNVSRSRSTSYFVTVRKILRDRLELLNELTKKTRFKKACLVCSVFFNILLIISICWKATLKNRNQLSGYVEQSIIIPSGGCEKDEFKNIACWTCAKSEEETLRNSRKRIQKYIYLENIICCVDHVPYVQPLSEVINNEYNRVKQKDRRKIKRQTQVDGPVAIHVELSQRVLKDGNLNWKTPPDWSPTHDVETISQSNGVFKIPFDGLYTIYESLITKFKNSSSNKKDEYIHVRIHKNSGRKTYKVLIQRNLKRWTGLQVYQGASSMASFFLQKGDDVELFVSDSDLILYKSKGINHFGIYKH